MAVNGATSLPDTWLNLKAWAVCKVAEKVAVVARSGRPACWSHAPIRPTPALRPTTSTPTASRSSGAALCRARVRPTTHPPPHQPAPRPSPPRTTLTPRQTTYHPPSPINSYLTIAMVSAVVVSVSAENLEG